ALAPRRALLRRNVMEDAVAVDDVAVGRQLVEEVERRQRAVLCARVLDRARRDLQPEDLRRGEGVGDVRNGVADTAAEVRELARRRNAQVAKPFRRVVDT